MNEIELTFLAGPGGLEVVLEADKRGGFFTEGSDTLGRFTVGHHDYQGRDWNAEIDSWIRSLVANRSACHATPPYGYGDEHGHGEGHGHGSGHGVGTAVAAGAAGLAVGVAGGLVAAEVVDEVGDFLEDDEGDEDGGGED